MHRFINLWVDKSNSCRIMFRKYKCIYKKNEEKTVHFVRYVWEGWAAWMLSDLFWFPSRLRLSTLCANTDLTKTIHLLSREISSRHLHRPAEIVPHFHTLSETHAHTHTLQPLEGPMTGFKSMKMYQKKLNCKNWANKLHMYIYCIYWYAYACVLACNMCV